MMSGAAPRIATPLRGERDWFVVPWLDVWNRLRFAPELIPGVRAFKGDGSKQPPFRHIVHRTHLSLLGYQVPEQDFGDLRDIAVEVAFTGCHNSTTFNLRNHQLDGIKFIRSRRGTLLTDEQRVGKSPQVIYGHDPDSGPLVLFGPLESRAVWHEWAARRFGACVEFEGKGGAPCPICTRVGAKPGGRPAFGGRPSFIAVRGLTYEPSLVLQHKPHVIFGHFAIARAWRQLFASLGDIGTLAVDEAHKAGIQSRNSITIESLRWLNTIAYRTVMLTGTPLYNGSIGLLPMLDIATPGAFGRYWDFGRRYAAARPTAYGWVADGNSNQTELRERLQEVMLRRTWLEIAGSLPPITRSIEYVGLSQDDRDRVVDLAARIRGESMGVHTRAGDLARLRRLYALEKIKAGVERAVAEINGGYSVVVWTWHREEIVDQIVEGLRKRGVRTFGPIRGGTAADDREAAIEDARAAVGPVAVVATMAALSTAVNLAFCSRAVFVELDYTPLNVSQAEMRIFDGAHPVAVTYLVADVDEERRLAEALVSKLGAQAELGLRAGVGDVRELLRDSFQIEDEQTLGDLAEAVMAEAA
jgi:hypothetical protein